MSAHAIRRAMVLAAGRGTRLAPLTDTCPKPLIPVAGRPMLVHLLEFLRRGGIEEVIVNLHHLGDRIEAEIGNGAAFDVRVRYSREDRLLDTAGGIKHAEPLLEGEPFVVVNGDSLLDLALRDVLEFHQRRGGIATIAARPDPNAASYGLVELDDDDRLFRLAGRPASPAPRASRPLMFPGLHVLEPEIFAWMGNDEPVSIARATYPRLVEAGRSIFGFVTDARWLNIDTPEALRRSDEELRARPFRFGKKEH